MNEKRICWEKKYRKVDFLIVTFTDKCRAAVDESDKLDYMSFIERIKIQDYEEKSFDNSNYNNVCRDILDEYDN